MKAYTVNYQVFPNETLKKVNFHGKAVAPMYMKIRFNREKTQYKCNLFELFQHPKYRVRVSNDTFPPDLEIIGRREEAIIASVIDKLSEGFSFPQFKEEYDRISRDLLSLMEPEFLAYLSSFLNDQGLPFLSEAMKDATNRVNIFEIAQDFKLAFKPKLYADFVANSLFYSPPYLPLAQFVESSMKQPYALTIRDYESPQIQADLIEYLHRNFQKNDVKQITDSLYAFVNKLS